MVQLSTRVVAGNHSMMAATFRYTSPVSSNRALSLAALSRSFSFVYSPYVPAASVLVHSET